MSAARARKGGDIQHHVVEKVQGLSRKSTRELSDEWLRLMVTPPPSQIGRDLLMRVIADHVQEAAYGGLPSNARKKLAALDHLVGNSAGHNNAGQPLLRLKPGAKLVRTWRGKTITVLVVEDGFEYQGARYKSLTGICRLITGGNWSGPRFFGLVSRCSAKADDGTNDAAS